MVTNIGLIAAGGLTHEDWLFIISIVIGILNLIVEYLKSRKKPEEEGS